ncbi:MAG: hypothetical protein ABEJ03_02895 [Candidatus Nanohaloarchaea archaeon]
MASRAQTYDSKGWEFPSLEARSGFEKAIRNLEDRASVEVIDPENLSEHQLEYGDGLSYALENIDETLEGNFEFVKRYRVETPSKTPVARNPQAFLASVANPDVYGEVYVIDTVKGAAVVGDESIVEYVEGKMDNETETLVERILEP